MINRRELVLLLALAFCGGVIFSDFTKPKEIRADVTNIVYDTLNAKIIDLSKVVGKVDSRVAALETSTSSYDSKINALSASVKNLAGAQKASLKEIDVLKKKMAIIQNSIGQ